jgi:hypothetical protein
MTPQELVKAEVEKLINNTKESLGIVKKVALAQAWKILQLAVASVVQIIEEIATNLAGPDKKTIAMEALSKFYDSVFVVVDIPFVPNFLEPIIHKYVKSILMIMVSATIDAMVTTFRNTGVFIDSQTKINSLVDIIPKVSDK